jgi:transmembrane sensor
VTLIEGHVFVVDEAAPGTPRREPASPPARKTDELKAGQQLAAVPQAPPLIAPADVQSVVAWTGGQLVFDNAPLSDVVARVNHYAASPVTLADREVGTLRISGSFNTGDVAGFVDIVTRYLPVKEDTDADGHIVLRKK